MAGSFNLIQVMKIVSPPDVPRPYRLVETYITSEGVRTRVCSGAYANFYEADDRRKELEAVVKGEEAV
ncbi:hypothetical protein I7G59_06380 [Sinorhizobium meliloti]|uniref:hypothetical protein n=1 Tax=Rhizobium meliloti TaxID=382 RepID=UPI0023807642|nr:hypothetical protein [Sinorhizobium meliloti]MDE3796960.1 hypothetical protein [Sinorhizobium meliloti]